MNDRGADAPDSFERGQRETEALREALDDLRADVRAMVRQELERAGRSGADVDRAVREALARERERSAPSAPPWRVAALVAAGVVIGIFAATLGSGFLELDSDGPETSAASPARGDPGGESAGAPAAPDAPVEDDEGGRVPEPADLAALYDSLFAARSPRLGPLVDNLEAAGPTAEVGSAIAAWRSGSSLGAAPRRRLHDALVQLALEAETGVELALDGRLTRDPCGGRSCGELLELWRARGEELGMPPLPEDPASDTPTLALVERVLVMRLLRREEAS